MKPSMSIASRNSQALKRFRANGRVETSAIEHYAPRDTTSTVMSASWAQLDRFEGRPFANLSDLDQALLGKALVTILDLKSRPSFDSEAFLASGVTLSDAERALSRLDSLRLGQPDPELVPYPPVLRSV